MKSFRSEREVVEEIYSFKKRYYLNQILKGSIVTVSVSLGVFLLISFVEYLGNFPPFLRAILLFTFLISSLWLIYRYVVSPLVRFFNRKKQISDEAAAKYIGGYFTGINDRLLNFVQLRQNSNRNSLTEASILQKAGELDEFQFSEAVDLGQNRKYFKYLFGVLFSALIIWLINPSLIPTGSQRVINYNKTFVPEAPFNFNFNSSQLLAFRNEDHEVVMNIEGESVPSEVYLLNRGRKIKMKEISEGSFSYTFSKIQSDKKIQFEAAGFNSKEYLLKVVSRPNLRGFNVQLNYPEYLNRSSERKNNIGNLEVPEGTQLKWQFNTLETNMLSISFPDTTLNAIANGENLFEIEKEISESQDYGVTLFNDYTRNRDKIAYNINVIPDQFPKINVNIYQDTILYNYIVLGGNIADDYGISGLRLYYKTSKKGVSNDKKAWNSVRIPINTQQLSQSYYYRWTVDSLLIGEGDQLNYFLQVSDNDGYNGIKSSKTGTYVFEIPSEEEMKEEIAKNSKKTESDIEESLGEAKELKENIEDLQNRLKGKDDLGWQEQKMLEELAKKREELNEAVKKLQEQFENEKNKRERFQNNNEELKKKAEEIQELMNELLDEETMKLYEELRKLLEEESENMDIQEKLDEIYKKEENLEKELERTLELFKRMKFEYKLDESIQELEEIKEEQDSLSKQTDESRGEELEELSREQESLQEKFEEFEEQMEELNELNQDMQRPESLDDFSEEQEGIREEMEKAQQEMQQKNRKKAGEAQENAQKKMQKMSEQLQQMQSSMEMQMMQANLDDLRDILQNLITLSFDQENLMDNFRGVDQSDPRFVELGQLQLKVKDDAKIVEDSLISLANRVFQLQSFVTREVSEMNDHLENSIDAIRERTRARALSEQQFAMTSMNNLALMLDDVMSSMQQSLSDAMGKNKKNGDVKMPDLSELQKQLNEKIQDLKESGKTGRQLSEELAKLAAEQERIRQALKEMEEKYGEGEGDSNEQLMKEMEDTETDLVNKRVTEQLIRRQRDIMTRLLEAEKSMRERELDDEREGETANEYEEIVPGAFEEYFKAKEKEVELLKTVPPKLYPYYKKEVDDYFKRIGSKTLDP